VAVAYLFLGRLLRPIPSARMLWCARDQMLVRLETKPRRSTGLTLYAESRRGFHNTATVDGFGAELREVFQFDSGRNVITLLRPHHPQNLRYRSELADSIRLRPQ